MSTWPLETIETLAAVALLAIIGGGLLLVAVAVWGLTRR